MIASCLHPESWSLTIARVTLALVGAALLRVSGKQLCRTIRGKGLGVVPGYVWAFTFAWSAIWEFFALWILFTCRRIESASALALYGASVSWVVFGLLLILTMGIRELDAADEAVKRFQAKVSADSEDGEQDG